MILKKPSTIVRAKAQGTADGCFLLAKQNNTDA